MSDQQATVALELPPYRAVLAVDVRHFSGAKAADHHALTEKIPLVLEQAFGRSGHTSIWEERRFPAGRGDGFVVGFRPEVLPVLIGPFLDSLQRELAYHHQLRPGSGPRMRVSVAVGPLTDSDSGRLGDGSGSAMVENHRLLDCEPIRRLLAESDPEVTFVAAVLSARVYEDVVLAGYSDKAASEFSAVPVAVKSYQGTAYLHVPKPSGALLHKGLGDGPGATENAASSASVKADQTQARHNQHASGDGNLLIGGNVGGDVSHKSRNSRPRRTS